MTNLESCKTCGYLFFGRYDTSHYDYYCELNYEIIKYPRKMGGRNKCPCYTTKAEYRREHKEYRREHKKRAIENHVYPKKPEIKKEAEE